MNLRGIFGLVILLAIAGAGLTLIDQVTREPIAQREAQRAQAMLTQLLPPADYDNNVLEDVITVTAQGLDRTMRIHRARRDKQPVATIADLTTPHGYSGDIRLLVAADAEGVVIGVRVIEHRETPGLGDAIEAERSDWIHQFRGRRVMPDERSDARTWAASRRGGDFDTLTSATITSTAVIDAVRAALLTQQALGEALWAVPQAEDPVD